MTKKVRTVLYWVIFGLFVVVWIAGFTLLTVCWRAFEAGSGIPGAMVFSAASMGCGAVCALLQIRTIFLKLYKHIFSKLDNPFGSDVSKRVACGWLKGMALMFLIVADVFLAIIASDRYFISHPISVSANVDWDLVQTIVFPILYIIAMLIIYRICKSIDSVVPERYAHRFDLHAFRWLFPHDKANFGSTIGLPTFLFELWNLLFSVGCVATVIVLGLCVGGQMLKEVCWMLLALRLLGIGVCLILDHAWSREAPFDKWVV